MEKAQGLGNDRESRKGEETFCKTMVWGVDRDRDRNMMMMDRKHRSVSMQENRKNSKAKKANKEQGISFHLPSSFSALRKPFPFHAMRVLRISIHRGSLKRPCFIFITDHGFHLHHRPWCSSSSQTMVHLHQRDPLGSNTLVVRIDHVIGQVDEELGETSLGGGVVAQHRREGGVAQGFGKTLA